MNATTTYIAVNHEGGYATGNEVSSQNEAWLNALKDAFGGSLEFRRGEDRFMEIMDGDKACFSAMSLLDNDEAAKDQCISRALKECGRAGGLRGRGVMEIVRDDAGNIAAIDPSTTDPDDMDDVIKYWEGRL